MLGGQNFNCHHRTTHLASLFIKLIRIEQISCQQLHVYTQEEPDFLYTYSYLRYDTWVSAISPTPIMPTPITPTPITPTPITPTPISPTWLLLLGAVLPTHAKCEIV